MKSRDENRDEGLRKFELMAEDPRTFELADAVQLFQSTRRVRNQLELAELVFERAQRDLQRASTEMVEYRRVWEAFRRRMSEEELREVFRRSG